jgi:hypothetical protein
MEKMSPRVLRKMGYKADSQGIISRYINVNGAWEGHLRHTREYILKVVGSRRVENLAVYGSGWLLDFPLNEITGMVGHIWLYDVIHPTQVIHLLRSHTNITMVTADITGGVMDLACQAVHDYKKHGKKISPEQLCKATFHPAVPPDYAVSLNILSQLGEMITEYLKKHVPYNQVEIDSITHLLQQSHLQLLQPGKSCLITDVKESGYHSDGRQTDTNLLIKCPLPLSDQTESWEWQFDPLGEYRSGTKIISQVVAFEL